MTENALKIAIGHPYFHSIAYGNIEKLQLEYVKRLNNLGFNVSPFCLTIDPPAQCLTFKQLDRMWKWGDRKLFNLYEKLERFLEDKDVFINDVGINLHPEFVKSLKVFKVFQCFDDPENSHNLSKPAAKAYDLCFVGNVAEVDTYKSWGIKNVTWVTMSIRTEFMNSSLTFEKIISGERDIDLLMMIDRLSPWRKKRMDCLLDAFPDAHFFGRGWPKGYLPFESQVQYLSRAKIGPNFHNSTGPINNRTFYLPANGVMQICDNKSYLSKLFELNKEVVGFDTVDECIDLCRYYLNHDSERREIAANGWLRAQKDYNEKAVFQRKVNIIQEHLNNRQSHAAQKAETAIQIFYKRRWRTFIYYASIKQAIYLKTYIFKLARKVKKQLVHNFKS